MSEFARHTEPPAVDELLEVLDLCTNAVFGEEYSEAHKEARMMALRLRNSEKPQLVYGAKQGKLL